MIGFSFSFFQQPYSDRRVILLAKATFCSHVNGLPSFVRKWRKSWPAQGSPGRQVTVLPETCFPYIDNSELKQRRFFSDAGKPEVVFFSFLDSGFAQMFGQIVSIIVKTIRNTNLVASTCFKIKRPHFQLMSVSQKRLCLSSLMILRAYIIVWPCKLWPEPELNVLVT